jgi:ribosomal-protein-alanine N-acetyltransferase
MMQVRRATSEDIPAILAIEHAAAPAAHWTETEYKNAVSSADRKIRVACMDRELRGFLVAMTAIAEWELENIAVAADARRSGIGRVLMQALIAEARAGGASEIRQEIRASNIAAQSLALRSGFEQVGTRPNYYSNPVEDALLFRLRI